MAREAIKASDDGAHQARQLDCRKKGKRKKQKKEVGQASFDGKKFSELNGNEKDSLLMAVALHLDLIEPEDD